MARGIFKVLSPPDWDPLRTEFVGFTSPYWRHYSLRPRVDERGSLHFFEHSRVLALVAFVFGSLFAVGFVVGLAALSALGLQALVLVLLSFAAGIGTGVTGVRLWYRRKSLVLELGNQMATLTTRTWRGRRVTKMPLPEVRFTIHPVELLGKSRWSGFALVARVRSQRMFLACRRSKPRVEEYAQTLARAAGVSIGQSDVLLVGR